MALPGVNRNRRNRYMMAEFTYNALIPINRDGEVANRVDVVSLRLDNVVVGLFQARDSALSDYPEERHAIWRLAPRNHSKLAGREIFWVSSSSSAIKMPRSSFMVHHTSCVLRSGSY